MNETKFKHLVRKEWLGDYWSECLELKSDVGFPDVHFLGPKQTVTLVEFKVVRQRDFNSKGEFRIPWRTHQPIFAAEYAKRGGSVGAAILIGSEPYWLAVEPSRHWVLAVQRPLTLDFDYLFPVDRTTIREFIPE